MPSKNLKLVIVPARPTPQGSSLRMTIPKPIIDAAFGKEGKGIPEAVEVVYDRRSPQSIVIRW